MLIAIEAPNEESPNRTQKQNNRKLSTRSKRKAITPLNIQRIEKDCVLIFFRMRC